MVRRLALLCLALVGCAEAWSPESIVEDLRVIGVRAEPAELKPGESASLSALILDPSRPGKKNTVLWIGCDPDPFNLGRSACSDPAVLQDPSALASAGTLPNGVHFIGLDDSATYATRADLFSQLAATDTRRQTGTVGQVLAIAIAEESAGVPMKELFDRVARKEVKAVIALFRIKVSESATRNTNPVISAFLFDGKPVKPNVPAMLSAADKRQVLLEAPDSAFEPYVETTPTAMEDKVERLTSAWYSTSGRFNNLRVALRSEVKAIFTAPGHPDFPLDKVPDDHTGTFFVVMRDTRGGQTWLQHPFWICDIATPPADVTAVRSPSAKGELVVVEGSGLDGILAVEAGGIGMIRGAYSPMSGKYEAVVPPTLAAGSYPVTVHRKNCSTVATGLMLTVP